MEIYTDFISISSFYSSGNVRFTPVINSKL